MKRLALLIDGSPNDSTSLEWAIDLSKTLGGELTVLHPHHQEVITAGAYEMAAVAIDNSAEVKRAAEAARAAYEKTTAGFGHARLVEVDIGAPEAVERLAHLEAHGPTPVAFGFAQPFGPDGRPLPRGAAAGDTCPAG